MDISVLTYMLYFGFAAISILGIGYIGAFINQKKNLENAYEFPSTKKKKWIIIQIFSLFYVLSAGLELLGHFIGIWTWSSIFFIPLHALVWWAPCLTVALFFLAPLNKYLRYIIFLSFVLLFELFQEAIVHFVTHNPFFFGTPYITIIIVMVVVCLTSFIALDLVKKLNWLK